MVHPQKFLRSGSFWRSALVVLLAATLATLAVRAWTGPSQPPAGGNPAGGGMTKLYDTTLGAAATNFDITNIPSGYDSLVVTTYLRGDTGTYVDTQMNFNGDTGANYYRQWVRGGDATPDAAADTTATYVRYPENIPVSVANAFSSGRLEIPNYANTTGYKSFTGQNYTNWSGTSQEVVQMGGTWRSTSALNRIKFTVASGNFVAGSRVTVYGIGPRVGTP